MKIALSEKKYFFYHCIAIFLGFVPLLLGCVCASVNHYYMGFFLILSSVCVYLYIVIFIAKRNWMDIRALFGAVWLFTIGLAALRLTEYQELWQVKTWLLLAIAYFVFYLGASIGMFVSERKISDIWEKTKDKSFYGFSLVLHERRLFPVCVVVTVIGLSCFLFNVAIRGYIPCFHGGGNAYLDFYTKFYIFAVASTGISGLCYYTLITQENSVLRKIILVVCIIYSTILFPILVVSRGAFVTSALSLTTVVFYLHRKKFWVLILCLLIIFGVYAGASLLRGYTEAQLNEFFSPTTISLNSSIETSVEDNSNKSDIGDVGENSNENNSIVVHESITDENEITTFTLPPRVAFIYSYLTVSHDNFNEAVENSEKCTYGIRQLYPFNVILRIDKINEMIDSGEFYLVRPYLNTANLISDFYYDFHGWGVFIFMLLWGIVFGVIQCCCDILNGPFSALVLGNVMTPVILSFFAPWMSIFSFWMHWGTILLMSIAVCLNKEKTKCQ